MKKFTLIIFSVLFFLNFSIFGQETKTALILIDIQEFYFDKDKMPLEGNIEAEKKAADVLNYFRETNKLIIHVMHKGGGQIRPLVSPQNNEKVVIKEQINSFRDTDLHEYLKENGITQLVILGMQTQMCLEAATRAGVDFGYKCTVIHDACAARDLVFDDYTVKAKDVHYSTLNTLKSYAKVISAVEFLEN